MNLNEAFEVYKEAKTRDIYPSQSVYYHLLSLSAGFGELGSGCNTVRESDPPSDFTIAHAVFRDMQANGHPMTESAYTAMIRCCCNHGEHVEALAFYNEMKANDTIVPKLRCFTPLLKVYSTAGDQNVCETLYDDLTQKYKIIPTEREYNYMLSVCIKSNCSETFYTMLEHMREDVFVPSNATWRLVEEWFGHPRRPPSQLTISLPIVNGTRRSLQELRESDVSQAPRLQTVVEYCVCTSSVSDEGVVLVNQEQLLSLDLDEPTRQALLEQIEGFATADATPVSERSLTVIDESEALESDTMAPPDTEISNNTASSAEDVGNEGEAPTSTSVHQTRKRARKIHKELSPGTRRELFINFQSHLSTLREKYGDIDVIVDGANVGYYKQNYANAPPHVDYSQINFMLIRLQSLGYKPLLILHCRHINYKYLSLSEEHIELIETWKRLGLLYATPGGCNDDWYWLYCAVMLRCKVVTNDEMRDHFFLMLSPRYGKRTNLMKYLYLFIEFIFHDLYYISYLLTCIGGLTSGRSVIKFIFHSESGVLRRNKSPLISAHDLMTILPLLMKKYRALNLYKNGDLQSHAGGFLC